MKKILLKRFLVYCHLEEHKKTLIMANLIFFLMVLNTQLQAEMLSQKLVSLSMRDATLYEMLESIEDQTNVGFLYNETEINTTEKVNIEVDKLPLGIVLKDVLPEMGIDFEIEESVIILKAHKIDTKAVKDVVLPEPIKIKGKITDKDGLPLPGATIIEQGTLNGVITDVDGNFTLNVADAKSVLKVSFIGFEPQTIVIGDKTEINIILLLSASSLEEVVVTGYQTISRERTTGSYAIIKEDDINRQVTSDLVERFEGLSTGLLTSVDNGNFGNKVKLTLRGQGTFSADDQPLVVVDGFALEGGLETINPNDIESVTILKDAAAASIWGVRSGNGVIVVTTKHGKTGKAVIEFSTFTSIEAKPNLRDFQIASSSALVDFLSYNIQTGINKQYSQLLAGSNIDAQNAVTDVWLDFDRGNITETERNNRLNTLKNTDVFKQYEDLLMRNAVNQQYNLSIRGGSETNQYYASITMNEDQSVMLGDENERINLNLKNDIDLSSKVRLNLGVNATFNNTSYNSEGLGLISGQSANFQSLPRFQNLVDANGNRLDIPRDYITSTKDHYEDLGYLDWSYNPLDELDAQDYTTKGLNIRLQSALKWKISSELNWDFSGMYERGKNDTRKHSSIETYKARHTINRLTFVDNNGKLKYQLPVGGILEEQTSETQAYTLRTMMNYNKTFNQKHEITALAGVEAKQIQIDAGSNILVGFDDPTQIHNNKVNWELLSGTTITNFTGARTNVGFKDPSYVGVSKNRYISSFFNAAYTYDKKYTFSMSTKIEQSSIFGLNSRLRANKLWSGGFAWNISNETFFDVSFINDLKFRLTYGINGNTKAGITTETVFQAGYNTVAQQYLRFATVGNPNLTQEDNYVLNMGFDFGLFDYRLNGTIDYYHRRSNNLLANFSTPSSLGYKSQYVNNGEILNKGIELSLYGDIIKINNFLWNGQLNFTYNKSKVIEYESAMSTPYKYLRNSYVKGEEIGVLLAYQWAGLSEDGKPQIFDENGEIIGYETDVLNKEVLVVKGSTIPPIFGSFNNTFSYKNITLGIFLTYKIGHKFRQPSLKTTNNINYQIHEDLENRWMIAGDENKTDIPRLPTYIESINGNFENWNEYYLNSDVLIEDASFIRIRDIYFIYSLSKTWLKKLPFDKVELKAQVRNVGLLWTANKQNIDPDSLPFSGGVYEITGSQSIESLAVSRPGYKPSPEVSFGINIQF